MPYHRMRYFAHRLFPKSLYAYCTKVRIPNSPIDFRKLLIAKYLLQNGGSAIDAGAHLGYHTRYLSEIIGDKGKVWAFEPNPYIFKLLQKYSNKVPNIIAHQEALSDIPAKEVDFHVTSYALSEDSSVELLRKSFSHRTITVKTNSIDALLERGLTDLKLIKVDVEGHEMSVFEGAKKTIARFRPCIIFEYAPKMMDNSVSYMHSREYICFDLSSLKILHEEEKPDLTDVLAIPREKEKEFASLLSCLKLFSSEV